jgi:CBS domain-containing protein
MHSIRVRDIMSSPAIVIDSQSSLPAAHLLMKEHGIRRLPVVDDGKLVGIITLGDVRGASPSEATTLNLFELSYLMDQLKVERVMTRQVITVTPDTSLAETARLMLENKISGLPVVSAEGRVVGVVTESDIFRVLVALGPDE